MNLEMLWPGNILTNTKIEPGVALTRLQARSRLGQSKRFMLEINKAIARIAYKEMNSMQIKVNPGLSEKYSNSSSRQQKK